uniref:Ubiquinol-cytochrome c reductase core protein 2b n=1 Tax=Seriola dumerili TaxID=41447 RepID=A0A3B4TK98_SERDU
MMVRIYIEVYSEFVTIVLGWQMFYFKYLSELIDGNDEPLFSGPNSSKIGVLSRLVVVNEDRLTTGVHPPPPNWPPTCEHSDGVFDQRDDMPQEFRPWEVSDLTPRVKMDRAQAAHSTQIGRDLYFPLQSYKNLHQFVQNNFTSARMVLWGIDARCALGKSIGRAIPQHRSGAGTTGAKAQYRGGELNRPVWHSTSSLVHSAVVSQSAAAGKQRGSGLQCAAASTGSWVHMSRGDQTSPTKLVQGVAKATADPFDSTLDSGLFGVYTISQAAAAGVIRAALAQVKAVADGGVTALRGQFLMSLETSEGFLEALATQALTDGTYISPRKSPRTLTMSP